MMDNNEASVYSMSVRSANCSKISKTFNHTHHRQSSYMLTATKQSCWHKLGVLDSTIRKLYLDMFQTLSLF